MRELFLEIKGLVLKTPGFPTSPTAWVSATIYTIYHNYTNYSVHSNHSTIHFPATFSLNHFSYQSRTSYQLLSL
jgi:hypothetical protein